MTDMKRFLIGLFACLVLCTPALAQPPPLKLPPPPNAKQANAPPQKMPQPGAVQKAFKLADGRTVKLGRKTPAFIKHGPEFTIIVTDTGKQRVVAQLGWHFDPRRAVKLAPPLVDYSPKAMASIQRIYLNDQEGDCVIASARHRIGIVTGNEIGTPALSTDQEVQNDYQRICGPGDNGCNITDVLDAMKTGVLFSGVTHKIDSYVSLDWTNKELVKAAIQEFGAAVNIGFDVPSGWMNSKIWSPQTATGGIVGGHDVTAAGYLDGAGTIVGFTDAGVLICTWGELRLMTWAAFTSRTWISECYLSLAPDWYAKGGTTPNGINVDTLRADIAKLSGGIIPDNPPQPKIVVGFAGGQAIVGVPFDFQPSVTGGVGPYSWSWSYGDGTTGTTATTHTYTTIGIYSVSATVTDINGASGSGTATVFVGKGPTPPPPGPYPPITLGGDAKAGDYLLVPKAAWQKMQSDQDAIKASVQEILNRLGGGKAPGSTELDDLKSEVRELRARLDALPPPQRFTVTPGAMVYAGPTFGVMPVCLEPKNWRKLEDVLRLK